jgi:aspartyl-tRNA synthetase
MSFDYRRTHTCGELSLKDLEKTVTLSGWVHKCRDLGGVLFIDLRDRFGITQLIFDPKKNKDSHSKASELRSEWVISIKGVVRAKQQPNAKLPTGMIEIEVGDLEILSIALPPPFSIAEEEKEVSEELRLKFRYLDIRRGPLIKNLILRNDVTVAIRSYLNRQKFIEVTTPILAKSTPEGARDYLVPSRIYPGAFYALPQSPQIFKQLLMIGGLDRYFQIPTCFRDEDLRADRQPEFAQVDIEMSFGVPEDLMKIIEELMSCIFPQPLIPFPKMTHKDCLENYGTDKPDLRFGMPLIRLDSILKNKLDKIADNGCVKSIVVAQQGCISRKEFDLYTQFIKQFNVNGLGWIKKQNNIPSSSLSKFLSESDLQEICAKTKLENGDLLLIAVGQERHINQGLDHLRRHIAKENNLVDKNQLNFLWVTDFPLFQWNEEDKKISSEHHPFTAPHPDDYFLLNSNSLNVRSLSYDLVLNGYEIGSGSQRIHNETLQEKIFTILQLTPEEIDQKFGFFVNALKYGTPPHLGIALGLDRIIMLLSKTDNIRDVIAFPKTIKGNDLMLQTPSTVAKEQLSTVHIKSLALK